MRGSWPFCGQRVVDARRGAGIGEAGAGGRYDGVDVERRGEPLQPEDGGEGGERPVGDVLGELAPAAGEMRLRHGADEGDLQQHVDDEADDDGADHGERHGALRVARFARHVDDGAEAEQREDDAAAGHGGEHAVDAGRHEAAVVGEVGVIEAEDDQAGGRQQRDRQLPRRHGDVGAREPAHAGKVDDDEGEQQRGGDGEALRRQRAVAVDGRRQPRQIVRGVLQHRRHLDGRRRHVGDPAQPAGHEAAHGAVREIGNAGDGAGERQHAAELGVDERQQQRDAAADQPGENGGGAGELRGVERGEQPARADDAGDAREQQRDGADLPLQAGLRAFNFFQHASPDVAAGSAMPPLYAICRARLPARTARLHQLHALLRASGATSAAAHSSPGRPRASAAACLSVMRWTSGSA